MLKAIWRFSSPSVFYPLAYRLAPAFAVLASVMAVSGLYIGFFLAPTDAQQGEVYRLIFIHVPAAWMSMFIYVVMAGWAIVGLIFRTRLSGMLATALAPTGALFTFIALWSGAMWGKPTWGAWWVWDARLTSELLLLFLYIGYIVLHGAFRDPQRADRACGVLAAVGLVNVPIIYYSVQWWNTLHQGASVSFSRPPSMAGSMLAGIIVMSGAAWLYTMAISMWRLQALIIERESNKGWLRKQDNFREIGKSK